MDEATSALDAHTEREIAGTLDDLSSQITIVVVAHRLATVRSSSLVRYLEDGRLVAEGSFEGVRGSAPSFDKQAQLLGL